MGYVMEYEWHIDGTAPLYLQLADSIKRAIISGKLSPGSRIMSVRELAFDAKVNPNTMQRALSELERDGLINTRGTTGKYVTDDRETLSRARDDVINILISDFTKRMAALGCDRDDTVRRIIERSDQK